MTVKKKSLSWWRWVIALLSAVALTLCLIMTWHSLSGSAMIGCSAGSSCDQVLGSRWSMILGFMPVSGLAVGIYLATLICSFYIAPKTDPETKGLVWKTLLVISGAIVGSAAWFIVLQRWMVNAFCPYCMSAHTMGIVLSATIIFRAVREDKSTSAKLRTLLIGVGVLLAVSLAAVQLLITPRNAFEDGYTSESLPKLDAADSPVIGDPEAEHIIDLLFDYQCSHCQKTHHILSEVVERYDGKVAFVLCPSPLSPGCNPYIPVSDVDLFAGSCELAKTALAVWRVDREAFYQFDQWLFMDEGDKGWYPRSVEAAQTKAAELIGAGALQTALQDQWIADYLSTTAELFGRTSSNGKGGIPRLIYGSQWIIPEVDNADGMVEVLQSVFGLPTPSGAE